MKRAFAASGISGIVKIVHDGHTLLAAVQGNRRAVFKAAYHLRTSALFVFAGKA
jgi:hypothetical protein